MLDRSGISRLHGLGTLLGGWAEASPNGVTSRLAAPGGLPYGVATWRVFIDGVEFPLETVGTRSFSRLPLSLMEVGSIHVHDGPGVVAGRVVGGGAFHFFTSAPVGLRAVGRTSGTNAAGEPGLQPGSNLDRLEGGRSAYIGYGTTRAGAAVVRSSRVRTVSDPAIRPRTRAVSANGIPSEGDELELSGMSGDLVVAGVLHRLRFSVVDGRDFIFLDPLGSERAAQNRVLWGSLTGRWTAEAANGLSLSYRSSLTRRSLLALPSIARTGLGFEEDAVDLDATLELRHWTLTLGGGRRRALGDYLEHADVSIARLEASVGRVGAGWAFTVSGGRESGEASLDAFGALTRLVSSELKLHASLLAGWGVGESQSSFWFWQRRGYRLLQEEGFRVEGLGSPAGGLHLNSELRLQRVSELGNTSGELGMRVRIGPPITLARNSVAVRDSLPEPETTLTVDSDVHGGPTSLWLDGRRTWGKVALHARLDQVLTVWGDDLWRDAWDEVPSTQLRLALDTRPTPDIDLGVALRYRADTFWSTWDVQGSEVDGFVWGGVEVDVTGRKTLWRGRLAASMRIEDLFDADLPSHPFGESPGLRLVLGVVVALGRGSR